DRRRAYHPRIEVIQNQRGFLSGPRRQAPHALLSNADSNACVTTPPESKLFKSKDFSIYATPTGAACVTGSNACVTTPPESKLFKSKVFSFSPTPLALLSIPHALLSGDARLSLTKDFSLRAIPATAPFSALENQSPTDLRVAVSC